MILIIHTIQQNTVTVSEHLALANETPSPQGNH